MKPPDRSHLSDNEKRTPKNITVQYRLALFIYSILMILLILSGFAYIENATPESKDVWDKIFHFCENMFPWILLLYFGKKVKKP